MRRAAEMFASSLGRDHPNTQNAFGDYLVIVAARKGVSVEALLELCAEVGDGVKG